jgi:adenine-specific DNA-methyltransferase
MASSIQKYINSLENERPTIYADRIGQLYISKISKEQRDTLGQYFTPAIIADFMSSLIDSDLKCIDILDPGAGIGVLSCSLIERIANLPNKPEKIQLVAYECDKKLLPLLKKCLDYTRYWLKKYDIILEYKVIKNDFILTNANVLENIKILTEDRKNRFDLIISNPPYFKISKTDGRAKISRSVIYGQPNIYALFMAVSASLLKESGQLIFITPRSFAAGSYFKLFREKFFSIVRPTHLHLFESRQKAFDRDAILQENIIIKAIREKKWEKSDKEYTVNVSSSQGLGDLGYYNSRVVPLKEIIDMTSKNKFLHIPLSDKDDDIVQLVNSWNSNLHDYNMEISTGPVVPFRAKELISDIGNIHTTHAPLLWMQNIKEMSVKWPVSSKKEQYIIISNNSKKLLVENKNYILMRRFSPKEDYKRLKTSPYLSGSIKSKYLGLENHLNFIYRPNGELMKEEIFGLSAVLNSKIIDSYIRTFNGNTEISATELRNIPLPPIKTIIEIGNYLLDNNLSNGDIDQFVMDKLFKKYKIYGKDQKAATYG